MKDKKEEDATEVLNNIQLKRIISTISTFTMETDNNSHEIHSMGMQKEAPQLIENWQSFTELSGVIQNYIS